MANQESAPAHPQPGTRGGWLKAILGTMGGLLSGAVVMYLTPLVDKAVRPAKPVANFKIDIDPGSLRVRFENLAIGGQGWWEFGDGSPLEPILPEVPAYHTYAQHGEYTAKMTLHNILGEENERTAPVRLEAVAPAEPPRILTLEAEAVSRGSFAPATFHLRGEVRGAQLLIWDVGDERTLVCEEVAPTGVGASSARIERNVTFHKPGRYAVKLAVVNGTHLDQKTAMVNVVPAPADSVTAVLTATDQGSRLEKSTKRVNFSIAFPLEHAEDVLEIDRQALARPGFTIKEVHVQGPSGREVILTGDTTLPLDVATLGVRNTHNLTLAFTQDRRTVRLTGELVRPRTAGLNPDQQPSLNLPIQVFEQRELPADRVEVPITTTLPIPSQGVTSSGLLQIPALPAGLVKATRKLRLELRDGNQVLWQEETALPYRVLLTLHNHRCLLTATQVNDQVHLDLREDVPAQKAAARSQ